ncbi:hypothetical protein [Nocardia sp. NBC_01327]|uniref:hypothetical protein n=1 Tax=Nocardia sp. NBC_01327 TaxID=2903593 RepID=UPI002E1321B6|nr:hypothetical protein OG326_35080 [Nocardia sp. NBC_01327]
MVFGAVAILALSGCSSSQGSTPVASGVLDTTFGSGGKVTTDLGSAADRAHAIAVQSDGKIVVAGSTQDPAQGDNFAVVRYSAEGVLDTTFGDGGKAVTDFGGKSDVVHAVAVQSDGKIVAVGTSTGATAGDDFAVARYTSDGKLDASFGTGGKVVTDLGTDADHANAVALQTDGAIVVAGSMHDAVQGDNFAVVRYTADGKQDMAFGDGGKTVTDFDGQADVANAVAVQTDGRILAVGTSAGTTSGDDFAIARYTSDGKLDATFGAGGKVVSDLGTTADRANAVALQQDGKFVVAGSTHDPVQGDNFAVVRYASDGKLDSAFGDNGKTVTDFGGKADIAQAVVLQSGGRIVAVGTSHGTQTGDNIALARYTADGKLDPSFGTGGTVSTDLGTQADHGNAAAVQADGKILVAGTTTDPAQGDNFALVRYAA